MVATALVSTGTSLVTLSVVPYIKDIVKGKAKPRAISWMIWTVLLGLTAVVSWQEGHVASAMLATSSTLACAAVSLLAVRTIRFELTLLERYTLVGAMLGIGLWLLFDDAMLVLMTAITVDTLAYLPTFANGWHNPHHESISMFVISVIGSSFVLAAALLSHSAANGLVYPVYSVVSGAVMVGILVTRRQV